MRCGSTVDARVAGAFLQGNCSTLFRTQTQGDCKAAFTFSRLKGTERSRTLVASKTAFEIEEGTTAAAGSPAPHGCSVGRSMSSITISGNSGKVRMG